MKPGRAAAALAVAAITSGGVVAVQTPAPPAPPLDLALNRFTRLLVIAPHPDDETLGAGGLLRRAVKSGASVRVAWMTSGDGYPEGVEVEDGITHPRLQDYRNYGRLREDEARAAVGALGVPRQSLTFLGFPDEGLCELASTYLSDKHRAFESPYTERTRPPPSERVIRGVRYRGTDVRREIERLLVSFAPTLVVTVHPEDQHPDHCSSHLFLREALDALRAQGRRQPRLLEYLIHYDRWPLTPDGGAGGDLYPPSGFPASEGRWTSLSLTPEEAAAKKQALLLYRSQMLVIGRFMLAFARNNELFLEGEPASLPECWCQNGVDVATELAPSQYRRRPRRR